MPDTQHESSLIKAIKNSEILELNEETSCIRSKIKITPRDQNEIDELTIYVEQIPLNSSHDSIAAIFSKFGKINYISLPRYKISRQLKQFGFVEFESKESVQKCLDCFKKFDAVLHSKPDKLLSIVTHETSDIKQEDVKTEEDVKEPKVEKDEEEIKSETDETDVKQEKTSENEDSVKKEPADENKEEIKKKKNRKHKRKQRKNKIIDERALTIKIMRKSLWKKMRNEYLNLERQKAKEVKKSLQESRKTNVKSQLVKFSPVINFYKSPSGNDQDTHDSVTEENNDVGSIVNIKFREVSHDLKELRQEFRQFSYVKHVEIIENGAECNVRVSTEQNAQELVSLYAGCEHSALIMSGESVEEYWKRIAENKEKNKRKLEENQTNPPAKKQRRGREKLAKMIMKAVSSQHIRFNDNSEPVDEK